MLNTQANRIREMVEHRPQVQFPGNEWQWYQEWDQVLFFHWQLDPAEVTPLLPPKLRLDLFEGRAWISLVPFTMMQVRPRLLPPLSFVSDFHEVNLRTYVTNGPNKGVYFFSLEAGNAFSAYISRRFSGLPYERSAISREAGQYDVQNPRTGNHLRVRYTPGEAVKHKTELDKWLTERYYLMLQKGDKVFEFHVHHPEWALQEPGVQEVDISYKLGNLHLTHKTVARTHYSPGVKVIAWPQEIIHV
ncbi:DUF2071 domain-containing protein [Chitinophaga horti]|uniref:DUF2071 domain-containing protein n=1 Tax=Chitinophaga horti TaxID=2920382 RepID=A0ABY6J354_9BACT|nr:DUF2071 domain-containing protein [Chitinophaga horti]UYQ94077.1 DUF2071 domain-containing protein [Chitinophaga horti]